MNKSQLFTLSCFAFTGVNASTLMIDNFDYANAPLAGQGQWARGVTDPTADNPSNHIVIENGQVKFDWTAQQSLNNAVRYQWSADGLSTGIIYAVFDLRVVEAPQPANESRPGFISFDRSGGGQMRGFVGIQAGSDQNTFHLGISASSQVGSNFTFSEENLELNTTYRIMVGYNAATAETRLWLNSTETADEPMITANGAPSTNVRRIQMRLFNTNTMGGTTNLGVFYLDNLQVYAESDGEPGEPDDSLVYFTETFAYPNGDLLDSAPEWRIREGSPGHRVWNNSLQLIPADTSGSHYITHVLNTTVDTGEIFFAATIALPALLELHPPSNIAFLTDASGAFGRGFLVMEGTIDGWRIGIRGTSTGAIAWASGTLPAGYSGRWVVGFNILSGTTSLWAASDGTAASPRAEVSGTGRAIRRIAIDGGTDLPTGPVELSNIHVASTREKAVSSPVDIIQLPHSDKVFLFLLAGQSNMAGRGAVEEQDRIGDRRIVYYNENRQWQVARDPLHWDRPNSVGVGLAMSFARELLPDLPPDAVIAFIPVAEGGSSIAWWEKNYQGANTGYGGQYLYHHALERAQEALQVGTFAAILWNQGESDAGAAENDGGQNYRNRLHGIIADFREDLGQPELPFIASTLGPWRTNANALNSVYLSLPEEVENTAVVNTNDPAVAANLVNNPNDTPHYLTPSYRLLGSLYAEAFRPWWNPSPTYVSSMGGEVIAGDKHFELRFTAIGGLARWNIDGHSLISPSVNSSAEWFLQNSPQAESQLYSFNPPLSFKWRNPRTMAAWSVGENEMGVVLANNDNNPARYRLSMNAEYLQYFRTVDGNWRPLDSAEIEQPVYQLRWIFPGNKQLIWTGEGYLKSHGIHGDIDLEVELKPKALTHWTWHYGNPLAIIQPQNYAVYQRHSETRGKVPFEIVAPSGTESVSVSIISGDSPFSSVPAQSVNLRYRDGDSFSDEIQWPAGGWYSLQVSAMNLAGQIIAEETIAAVGIGEVFLIAGQSNATNSGQTPTRPASKLVSAFSGTSWRPASDPMPGTHDNALGGSFQPSMGDELVAEFGVPVGFASTGQGGSAIRHWQPDYQHDFESNTFYNGLYDWTLYRMQQLGGNGFRALLWHQGESNAAQGQSTDPGKVDTYYNSLKGLLQNWRSDTGWYIPVFTAKASLWPMANAEFGGDPYLREAQQKIWDDGIAYQGPDSDQLGLEYRQDNNESRVHFNAAGLKRHGEMWAEAVIPFIIEQNEAAAIPAPWEDASWSGDGSYFLPWFGLFQIYGGGFIIHSEHGVIYSPTQQSNRLWLYINKLGWIWTSPDVYPFLWEHDSRRWLYYLRGGNSQYRDFYRFESDGSGNWQVLGGS